MSTPIKRPTFERRMCAVSEDVLFWAFRYTLGRKTYAVSQVTESITMNVSNITKQTAQKMIEEIEERDAVGGLGMDMDAEEWRKVRDLLQKKVGGR